MYSTASKLMHKVLSNLNGKKKVSTFLERIQLQQKLSTDDDSCQNHFQDSLCLLLHKGKPLIKFKENASGIYKSAEIVWTPYKSRTVIININNRDRLSIGRE